RPRFELGWSDSDRYGQATGVALVGVAGALLLALFGLPPVSIHEPWHFVGIMGPTCGMTRAVRLLALGDPTGAWSYNPGSFALTTIAAALLGRAGWGRLTGRWLTISSTRTRLLPALAVIALAVLWWN